MHVHPPHCTMCKRQQHSSPAASASSGQDTLRFLLLSLLVLGRCFRVYRRVEAPKCSSSPSAISRGANCSSTYPSGGKHDQALVAFPTILKVTGTAAVTFDGVLYLCQALTAHKGAVR